MNSWYHAVSSAKKWGGQPEHYVTIHEFIDSSKKFIGDVRHRSIYHHTEGIWLCQMIFGHTIDLPEGKQVPVRLVAERHIIEDLGWIPSPADYIRDMPIQVWMSGKKTKTVPLETLGATTPS